MGGTDNRRKKKKKGMQIGLYDLDAPLTMLNGGFSKWGFCTRDGKELFIKEFLSPVFPDTSSDLEKDILDKKVRQCKEWFEKKRKFY